MKLSEAILKGCEMTPKQAFGEWGQPGDATCALGAAYEAVGARLDTPACDVFPGIPLSVIYEITDLNDDDHWSRERIASWLAEKGL